MIGKNKLLLNEATMRAAVEMYINHDRKSDAPDIKVTGIWVSTCTSNIFEVQVECSGHYTPVESL